MRYTKFDIGVLCTVVVYIRQLEKMLDIGVKPRKKLIRKNKEKHSVAPKKTSRYIEFDIGVSFTVLLILRQLRKMLDVIAKRMKNIESKKY